MKVGDKKAFIYSDGNKMKTGVGIVISTNKVTSDGIPYAEVQFADKMRKYSLQGFIYE